jgi:hypothetical protein
MAGADCELEAGFVAQQAVRAQQSAQLPMAGFTQTAANAGAEAICIHTNTTLNKMAVNGFTTHLVIH